MMMKKLLLLSILFILPQLVLSEKDGVNASMEPPVDDTNNLTTGALHPVNRGVWDHDYHVIIRGYIRCKNNPNVVDSATEVNAYAATPDEESEKKIKINPICGTYAHSDGFFMCDGWEFSP